MKPTTETLMIPASVVRSFLRGATDIPTVEARLNAWTTAHRTNWTVIEAGQESA